MHIIIAVVLLQTIGLFHPEADQRVSSNVYHGMLVMVCDCVVPTQLSPLNAISQMIRRTGLINRVALWTPPDLNDVSGLDKAWREWAQYETVKR